MATFSRLHSLAATVSLLVTFGTKPVRAEVPQSTLRVMVFEYSGLPENTLLEVEKETSRIFHISGIDIQWIHCRTREWKRDCQSPTPSNPSLRFVSRFATVPGRVHKDTMGFTTGDYASVSVAFARELEMLGLADLPEILAHLAAHELGHVLLPGDAHTVSGLMRANWTLQDWSLIQRGNFNFTPQQARFMRAELLNSTAPVAGR